MSVEGKTQNALEREFLIFGPKHNIPSIKSDLARWDKGWEKALPTLSASKDVYPTLSVIWSLDESNRERVSEPVKLLLSGTNHNQQLLLELEDYVGQGGHITTAWLLLGEAERKRHLLDGLKEICRYASIGENVRALCPEITTSAMLKRQGSAFLELARTFINGINEVGERNLYHLPSAWWQSAIDTPEPWPEDVKFAFTQLTVQRNEFIAGFILHSLMSVFHDLALGSPGMNRVTNLMKSEGPMAANWAQVFANRRDKPLIRCENCTKTPDEVGKNVKFMVCSSCKSKLNFVVHYCSQACQKEDWRNHKKHCGKQKVSKKLPGTVHDDFWQVPNVPDSLRNIESTDGYVSVTNIGFGTPHPSRPHSAALQRQYSLLEGDRGLDYVLFDEVDRPIPFVIFESSAKLVFRQLRSTAMFSADREGLEAIAQYMIKVMSGHFGLSRTGILGQLTREYGVDVASKLATFEANGRRMGHDAETTFVDMMSRSMRRLFRDWPEMLAL